MIFKFDIWKTYLVEGKLQKYTCIFKSRQVAEQTIGVCVSLC